MIPILLRIAVAVSFIIALACYVVGQRPLVTSDIDYPLNNAVNSFFPIDADINFNTTNSKGNITQHAMAARYASFLPIIDKPLSSKYTILQSDACSPIKKDPALNNTILVVLRGECTFVAKVANIVRSDVGARGIIIANDEPHRGLITMYSSTFNQDGRLLVPVMFLTFEDYNALSDLAELHVTLHISTALLGLWLSIVLLMVLSPPLLILLFYVAIVLAQKHRKHQENLRSSRLVKQLRVYIFNVDHLISVQSFAWYLDRTHQSIPADSPAESANSSRLSLRESNNIIVNGTDVRQLARMAPKDVLTAPGDFFPAYKCLICLDKYTPLLSRVLILECKHFYHERCLSNWLINFRRSCPLCNTTVGPRTVEELGSNSYGDFERQNTYSSELRDGPYDEPREDEYEGRLDIVEGTSRDIIPSQSEHLLLVHGSLSTQYGAVESRESNPDTKQNQKNTVGVESSQENDESVNENEDQFEKENHSGHSEDSGNTQLEQETQESKETQSKPNDSREAGLPQESQEWMETDKSRSVGKSELERSGTASDFPLALGSHEYSESEPRDVPESQASVLSGGSSLFFLALSNFESPKDTRKPRFFDRPLHILSQYLSQMTLDQGTEGLSTSIDLNFDVKRSTSLSTLDGNGGRE